MLKNDTTKPVTTKKPVNGAQKTTAKKPTAARKPAASARQQDDLQQRIQQRAYELWEHEGRPHGREQDHWLQAQHEIALGRKSRAGAKL